MTLRNNKQDPVGKDAAAVSDRYRGLPPTSRDTAANRALIQPVTLGRCLSSRCQPAEREVANAAERERGRDREKSSERAESHPAFTPDGFCVVLTPPSRDVAPSFNSPPPLRDRFARMIRHDTSTHVYVHRSSSGDAPSFDLERL